MPQEFTGDDAVPPSFNPRTRVHAALTSLNPPRMLAVSPGADSMVITPEAVPFGDASTFPEYVPPRSWRRCPGERLLIAEATFVPGEIVLTELVDSGSGPGMAACAVPLITKNATTPTKVTLRKRIEHHPLVKVCKVTTFCPHARVGESVAL